MPSEEESRRVLAATAEAIRGCTLCRLHATRTNAVPGEGPVSATVLLVGEAPGRDEDLSGRPFVGRAGRILNAALDAAGLPRGAVYITNVVKCRPPENRRPKADEAAACRTYLLDQFACIRPRVIVTLGATALRGVLGRPLELAAARGHRLELDGTPVVATYHPAAVLYNRSLEKELRRDLAKVARRWARGPGRGTRRRTSGRTPSRGPGATRSRRPPP